MRLRAGCCILHVCEAQTATSLSEIRILASHQSPQIQLRLCSFQCCFEGAVCVCLLELFWACVCADGILGKDCACVCDPSQTERAPHSSPVTAVLAPYLVGLAIAVAILGLTLAPAKLRERRQTEGGLSPRQLEAPGGRNPPAELGNTSINTLAAHLERLV